MADEWYTASQLAAAALPGLSTSKQRIIDLARREAWDADPAKVRKRQGRGGGTEYHISLLPEPARVALLLRQAAVPPAGPPVPPAGGLPSAPPGPDREAAWAHFDRLPETAKAEARRRLGIVQTIDRLVAGGLGLDRARRGVAEQTGESFDTLRRWGRAIAGLDPADWLPALAPRYVGRTATADCSPEAWDYFKADYLRLSQPAGTACYERLQRAAAQHGWTIPSYKTLLRRIEREIAPEQITLAREGEKALARRYPAQVRDRSVFRAMAALNADGHQWDLWVRWPDGEVCRPRTVHWQDLYSGKMLGWRCDKTENADAVRLSFGDTVERWGIPEQVYLDNGRGFASKWMTGGMAFRHRFKVKAEEPAGIFTQLGKQVHWATPYHGQAKPIERAFLDLIEYVAKHPKFEGAYTGAVGLKETLQGARRISRAIRKRLDGTGGLLIVDEAQHLSVPALEALRGIHDATGVGLALVGNEKVYSRLTGGTRAADFAQLYSRIGVRFARPRPVVGDVRTIAGAWGIKGRPEVEFLESVAQKPGALRSCTAVLKLARTQAGEAPITVETLRAAWANCNLVAQE